jgi:O-methyltransferase
MTEGSHGGMGGDNVLENMLGGYRDTQMLVVAARFAIADHLAAGPRSAEDLARTAGVHAGALRRVLRALSGRGVFREREDGRFELTAIGERLRREIPGSVHGLALSYGEPWWWAAWDELAECVRTGKTAFNLAHGCGLFEFLSRNPKASAAFNGNMAAMTLASAERIASTLDLAGASTVADVGGGRGLLLASVLKANPALRGLLCEQPQVLEEARDYLLAAGVLDCCDVAESDIFSSIPRGADVYLLKEVLHDWDDERASAVLRVCRASMCTGTRLMVIERLIGPINQPSKANDVDIVMLVMTGGFERTEFQFRTLIEANGFRLRHTRPTQSGLSVLEAEAT